MALQENRIGNGIAVIGAGTTGYLTTLFLCKNYPHVKIKWIYPENNTPIGVGEATVPEVTKFLKDLGITPKIIINEINGSLKVGVKFKDFYKPNHNIYHPFGATEEESYNLKYCMENDIVPDDILDYDEIAMHFDVRELMLYLDKIMKDLPNLTIERRIVNNISEVEEDTVIDCTGFKRALSNYEFVDITDKIPNNKALVYRTKYKNIKDKVPYTTAVAADCGWIWETPLNKTIAYGYVHDGRYNVKEEFIQHLKKYYDDIDESLIREVPMITGRNVKHIIRENGKTIIALGLSSFFIEPLESTGLYLVVYGIKTLDKYLKGQVSADYYNYDYNHEFDVILDFIIAHYKYSTYDTDYWNHYKNLDIQTYRENNIFPRRSWDYLLSGFNQVEFKPKMDPLTFMRVRKGTKYCEKDFT